MRIIVSRAVVSGRSRSRRERSGITEIGQDRELWLVDLKPRGKPPLDMEGAGERPGEQPKGDQPGDDAAYQHKGLAEVEQVCAGDNEGDDDDAEAAGDHDRGADRGDEDGDGVVSAVAGTRAGFSVHGRPNSGDAVESTRGLMMTQAPILKTWECRGALCARRRRSRRPSSQRTGQGS